MAQKVFTGKVVSNRMQKTVVIEVERKVKHPLYKRMVKKVTRLKADTGELAQLHVGDMVKIQEVRPLSRDKHFRVVEKRG